MLNGPVTTIRDATEADAAACAEIYATYVQQTYATFEEEPPDAEAMAARIAASQRAHAWLVAESDGGGGGAGDEADRDGAADAETTPAHRAGGPGTDDTRGRVVGFAYGSTFKERVAYRYSCEVSIYLDGSATGQGLGRRMYEVLLERLTALGYRQAISTIALPHPSSVGLHEAMGFELAGTLRAIGWKHGGWRDVAWYQRPLGEGAATPAE